MVIVYFMIEYFLAQNLKKS